MAAIPSEQGPETRGPIYKTKSQDKLKQKLRIKCELGKSSEKHENKLTQNLRST